MVVILLLLMACSDNLIDTYVLRSRVQLCHMPQLYAIIRLISISYKFLKVHARSNRRIICSFTAEQDETTLIWYSHGEERTLKLASVSRIIPGQRTVSYLCILAQPQNGQLKNYVHFVQRFFDVQSLTKLVPM